MSRVGWALLPGGGWRGDFFLARLPDDLTRGR